MIDIIVRANGSEDVVSTSAKTVGELLTSGEFRARFEVPPGSSITKNNVATTNGASITTGDVISWVPPVGTKG
jgi:hypothetical protein